LKNSLSILLLLPFLSQAHPGIGIVKDSKGNIYYTDLQQVWKISNGKKTVAVPNVHTHELYIDAKDNLYGENETYNASNEKFYHYLWVRRANGKMDTVIGMKEDYIVVDFSLARDKQGNEYYTKQFARQGDTTHIYKKTLDGRETIFATGNFKGVVWLHPQKDGSLLYVSNNNLYRVDAAGTIQLLKNGIANAKPSFPFSKDNPTVWGVWQDRDKNIYAAAFSDQAVKRIDANGKMTVVYQSTGKWTPLHGVFDNEGHLWVLEGSDKNEVRVTKVEKKKPEAGGKSDTNSLVYFIPGGVVVAGLTAYWWRSRSKRKLVAV
jgi:hypothetical protein